jgi:sulfur carrier protein
MTTITLNGARHTSRPRQSVADLVEEVLGVRVTADGSIRDGSTLGIAVAVNSVVVPRSAWVEAALSEGDAVEIVSATQGG